MSGPNYDHNNPPMMTCGHAANGHQSNTGNPVCLICMCHEVDEDAPDLSKRMARCTYYGKRSADGRFRATNESNQGTRERGALCNAEAPSTDNLAFFKHRPNKEFDEFYCGCHGWD